jgi:hypothetical protein
MRSVAWYLLCIFDTQWGYPIHLPSAIFIQNHPKHSKAKERPLRSWNSVAWAQCSCRERLPKRTETTWSNWNLFGASGNGFDWLWLPSPSANVISKPEALKTKIQNLYLSFLLNLSPLFPNLPYIPQPPHAESKCPMTLQWWYFHEAYDMMWWHGTP